MQVIKPEKIIETISNLKTGEVYKNEDMAQDVNVVMPSLDLFGKTK